MNTTKKRDVERAIIYTLILVLISISCTRSEEILIPEEFSEYENISVFPVNSEPEFLVEINRSAVYGDTEEVLLGSRLNMTVDDQGRVYIADNQEVALHVYNPDGSYNRQIGQEGDGPGEYRMIRTIRVQDRYLHILDLNLSRITRYNLENFEVEGELSISIDQEGRNDVSRPTQSFYLIDSEQYLLELGVSIPAGADKDDFERTIEGLALNYVTNEIVDSTVFSFPAGEYLSHQEGNTFMVMQVPYNRKPLLSVQNGQIIQGWSDDFFFKVFDEEGEYQRSIYYPYENLPLERNEVLEIYSEYDEQWQDMVREADMPDTWPVFDSMVADNEGRIWVGKLTQDPDELEYIVLENSGEMLASFNWPSNREIQEIQDGNIYTLETNEETGLREAVKYEFTFVAK